MMLLTCGLLLTRCSAAHMAKEKVQKLQAGVEAAAAILEVLGDENFSEDFGKIGRIAAKMGPFLGALGPALAMAGI